jgi:hypothetical protein
MTRNASGYILIMTTLLVSLLTLLGTYMFQRSMVHVPYMNSMVEREKARMLALSGVEIFFGMLAEPIPEKKDQSGAASGAAPAQQPEEKEFLSRFLPVANRWQRFQLTATKDGVDGEIGVYMACEDGKIDLNELYDFKKHAFKGAGKPQGDMQKVVQELCTRIEKRMGGKQLFEGLSTLLKNRKEPLNDVTELIMIPAFKDFKYALFCEPPRTPKPGEQKEAEKQTALALKKVYLTDLFTLASHKETIQPWVFSRSLQEVLELVPGGAELSVAQQKQKAAAALKNFKQKMTWQTDWQASLGAFYGKDFTSLPNSIQSMFDTTFEPVTFSVVAYGTVNGVTQRLFSIIERQSVATKAQKKSYIGKMKRLYWF